MKVLITGATGSVGLAVSEVLIESGHVVCMLADTPPPAIWTRRMRKTLNWHAEICDIRDPLALRDITLRMAPDVFIHGAALTPAGGVDLERTGAVFAVNALGTANALEAAAAAKISRFVMLSSASVYGDASYGTGVLDEVATIPRPTSLYAMSKFVAEGLCQISRQAHPALQIIVLRLGSVFGRWEHETEARETLSAIYQVTKQALAGSEVVLPRSCRRDWIYSRDVGEAVRTFVEASTLDDAIVNVGLGHEWLLEEWCAKLASRIPAFRWRLSDGPGPSTIALYTAHDRTRLATDRLARAGLSPRYDLDAAFADYLCWISTAQST